MAPQLPIAARDVRPRTGSAIKAAYPPMAAAATQTSTHVLQTHVAAFITTGEPLCPAAIPCTIAAALISFASGSTDAFCGTGCQPDFGICGTKTISPDGSCGGTNGYICPGTTCCSKYFYWYGFLKFLCLSMVSLTIHDSGATDAFCGVGCQPAFGDCSS